VKEELARRSRRRSTPPGRPGVSTLVVRPAAQSYMQRRPGPIVKPALSAPRRVLRPRAATHWPRAAGRAPGLGPAAPAPQQSQQPRSDGSSPQRASAARCGPLPDTQIALHRMHSHDQHDRCAQKMIRSSHQTRYSTRCGSDASKMKNMLLNTSTKNSTARKVHFFRLVSLVCWRTTLSYAHDQKLVPSAMGKSVLRLVCVRRTALRRHFRQIRWTDVLFIFSVCTRGV